MCRKRCRFCNADNIIVLEDGRVAKQGSHERLLKGMDYMPAFGGNRIGQNSGKYNLDKCVENEIYSN